MVTPLAALPAVPALASNRAGWEAARTAFEKADREVKAYDRDYLTPAADRFLAWRDQWPMSVGINDCPKLKQESVAVGAWYDPIEKRFNKLTDIQFAALSTMLEFPAPDANAVACRVEAMIADNSWENHNIEQVMGYLLADLRRLGEVA